MSLTSIINALRRQPPLRSVNPAIGKELVQIDCRGCMGTDYHVMNRGLITKVEWRESGYGKKVAFYVAKGAGGSTFDAIADRCTHAPSSETSRLAGEDLTGKIVELI